MNNVLVTGGQGFIGQHLVLTLVDLGYNVTVVDIKSNIPCFAQIFYPQECGLFFEQHSTLFQTKNLADLLGSPVKYDAVIHLAAIPRVGVSLDNPMAVIKNNTNSTLSALEYCRKSNTPLLNVSSSSAKWADTTKNPYALSKLMGEQMVNTYRETFGVKATNVRLFNVYGPGEADFGQFTTLIRRCKTSVETKMPLPLYGDGTNIRDYTHVFDVVQALTMVLRDLQHDGFKPLYEIGAGSGDITVNDIIREFGIAGLEVEVLPARQGDAPYTKADSDLWPKGWRPKINVLDHVQNWVQDYLSFD